MSEPDVVSDSRVLLLALNVAVASVVVGLAGLVLWRFLAGRSTPLQHGVLVAALAVLLLAPVLFAVCPWMPGIGYRVTAWPGDAPAADVTASSNDRFLEKPGTDSPWLPQPPVTPSDVVQQNPFREVAGETPPRPIAEAADSSYAALDSVSGTAATIGAVGPARVVEIAETAPTSGSDRTGTDAGTVFSGRALVRIAGILLLIWLTGIVFELLRCSIGFVLVGRLRRRARMTGCLELPSLAGVCADIGLRTIPPVLESDGVEIPLTIGLFRPAIVLPANLVSETTPTRLRAILLHEAAHVARRDLWVGVLQRLAAALYWWNPLVHRLNTHLNDVRECLCDNHVLLAGGDERDYADTLLTLAARIARPDRAASVLGLVGRPSPGLSGRVTHLLERDRDMSVKLTRRSRSFVLLTSLGVISALSLFAVRGPENAEAFDQRAGGESPAAAGTDTPQTTAQEGAEPETVAPPATTIEHAESSSHFWGPEYRESLQRSVVRIEVENNRVPGDMRIGSGVVIFAGEAAHEHGMQSVLTAAHLLNDSTSGEHTLRVHFHDESEPRLLVPEYIDVDDEAGLALVCFPRIERELPPVSPRSSQNFPEIGAHLAFYPWNNGFVTHLKTCRVVAVNQYPGSSNIVCAGMPEKRDSGGGLFNDAGELVGILVAADSEGRRSVFASLPAILEFLGMDEEAAEPPVAPSGLPVTGTPIGLPGPPHLPLGGSAGMPPVTGPGPGVLGPGGVVAEGVTSETDGPPNRNDRDVILITLSANDDGSLGEVHLMTDSLGEGDEAIDQLKEYWLDKVKNGGFELIGPDVQISVDPRLRYGDTAKITVFFTEQDTNLQVLVQALDDFQLNIGFVRDSQGRQLSYTPVVFWDDQVRSTRNLSAILEAERRRQPASGATLELRADSDVPANVIQDVIRQAQSAGFEKFTLNVLQTRVEQPRLNGVILDFDSDTQQVRISIGSDDGLKLQDPLDVYRVASESEQELIGRIEIIRVLPDQAVARVLSMVVDDPINVGDRVIGPPGVDARFPEQSRLINAADEHDGPVVKLHVTQPESLHLHWTDPVTRESQVLVAPCRFNVTPGVLPLKLTAIPGKTGLELRASIQIQSTHPAAAAFLEHNAVPIEVTAEDLDQAESGNHVVKVVYLPDPEFQEVAIAGVETLVTTRLDPGVDPIAEADGRGTILAVIRIGNRQVAGAAAP